MISTRVDTGRWQGVWTTEGGGAKRGLAGTPWPNLTNCDVLRRIRICGRSLSASDLTWYSRTSCIFFTEVLQYREELQYSRSTDRELLTVFVAMKYFQTQLEGREFEIYTDHKPLVPQKNIDKRSPRQICQLEYIVQFNVNIVAMSRTRKTLNVENREHPYTISDTVQRVRRSTESRCWISHLSESSFESKLIQIPGTRINVWCDVSTSSTRLYVPKRIKQLSFKHSTEEHTEALELRWEIWLDVSTNWEGLQRAFCPFLYERHQLRWFERVQLHCCMQICLILITVFSEVKEAPL
jgi:hypothetical protein